MNTQSLIAAAKFFSLAETAAKNGGFWVSAAGGTANAVAGVISRATGVTYEEGHHALDVMGREVFGADWYQYLADIQPFRADDCDVPARWDARIVARAACRGLSA
ncbi:MAG: hypothetical protein IBX55_08755 [Methyloprofundus sp.]|nr:hypothetical protein [Methyloprofundus sp.]